jgi:hypothetical protein
MTRGHYEGLEEEDPKVKFNRLEQSIATLTKVVT